MLKEILVDNTLRMDFTRNAIFRQRRFSGGMRAAQRAGEGFRGHLKACFQVDTRGYLREGQRPCHHDDIFLLREIISVLSVVSV